jgi:NAD(P)H-hydrate epimerase
MAERDVVRLRDAGFDDRAIVDANQVVAYFNYVNRVADGLGVELEREWPEELREGRPYWASVPARSLPWLEVGQMRELDRIAIEEHGLTLERMMENAGRSLAELARRLLGGRVSGRRVAVLAGPGGNGGGGLVAARHLASAGGAVDVVLERPPERLSPVTRGQLEILTSTGVAPGEPPAGVDLVLDALLGYSQRGAPREEAARLIEWCAGKRVLALDVPSGLELATGRLHEPHVSAEATLTLAAPKRGLVAAADAVGALFLADLSIPAAAYERLGVEWRSPFASSPLVRIST